MKALILGILLSVILTSCGGGGSSSGGSGNGNGKQDTLNLSGTVTFISHFILNEANADSLPGCNSTCDKATKKCATLSLVSNASSSDITLETLHFVPNKRTQRLDHSFKVDIVPFK